MKTYYIKPEIQTAKMDTECILSGSMVGNTVFTDENAESGAGGLGKDNGSGLWDDEE